MISKYIVERRSWIAFVLFMHVLILSVAYLDSAIPFKPVLYIVFLSTIIFTLFLILRYHQETKFYRSLEEWDCHLDIARVAYAHRPFEQIIEQSIVNQTEQLKQEVSQHLVTLEQDQDELLAWIHEVKTPLTAMHLMIDRLEDETMKTQLTYEWLRIHLLLDQQLHHKRLRFIENDLYLESTQLKSIISQEIRALQSWCMQKGIGFDIDLQSTEVLSDAKWLAFIIRQLLTNAVKYSESSDILIRSYQQNEQIILEIEDFGRGIDSRDIPRIFDKGFTSTTTHHDNAATGMGLYLAAKAAKPLLIHIGVSSELGSGTTFTLSFPKKNEFVRITGM